MDSNIKHLYDTMISRGYTGLGDFSNFEGKMKDSGKRKLVYDHLMQDDYFSEIGDFPKFESALGYSPIERKDYVSQSSVNPAPIALRQEVDIPMSDQSEYVNPWTNSPDYNFESLRKKGKIETATPPPPTEYEKDSPIMNTWAGDAVQKLNAGGAELGAGIFGVLDKASKGLESATGGLIPRGGAFKDISDRFKADAEFSRARSNRYNGKDFTDLWKEGNYMGAIGDIALQGIESLPMSIGAMAATMAGAPAAGLAGIGSIVASQKYDDLDQNNPNMGEFAKVSNAILTGTAESLSEMLGAGVSKAWMSTLFKTLGKEKAQEAIKRGIMGKVQEFYKKFGMFFEPVNEGIEEVSSTLAENITDKITGADPERDLTDGVLQSFVYGMGGGAYFTGAGALAKGAQYVADKIGGEQAQQPITDSNVSDQGVNTTPQFTKSIIDDAFEQGRNMSDKGDLRDLSLQMEASRTALTEKNPNLAIRMEQYIDNGASENQINEMLKGVDNETRELAYDFYINTQKIKGVEDKSIENINNEVDSYMSDNIIPYVSISPNGRQVISTATFKEGLENKKVYIRSINGDNVIISDNGNNRMVPMSSLSDIEENDVEQIENSYRQQLLVARQFELDMAMNHNPKTQLPKPGLVIWNGDNAFILQGQDENGDWIAQPAAYDKETGQVTAKAGSSPAMPITEREILGLQDAMYDAQQASDAVIEQPVADNMIGNEVENEVSPSVEQINMSNIETGQPDSIGQQELPGDVETPVMVIREDGTPDFVASGIDNTLDYLSDKYGEKMPKKIEVTRKAFDEDVKKVSEKLDKAQEAYDNAPIGKEDKVEAALVKARQEYEAIKVEADFWIKLDEDIKKGSEGSGEILPGEQLDQTGRVGEIETREQVGTGIDRTDGAAQEGASEGIKPIGKGFFGYIYDQFKGKVKEAFDFLVNNKEGDLLGVFHRDGIGSIDLVWGNDNGGLKHIIKRHIEEQNDFYDVSEIQSAIDDAISNGDIARENEDKIVLQTDRYKVSINKQYRDENGNVIERKNWVVTAFDKTKKKGEKKNTPSRETLTTPSSNLNKADGVTLPSNGGISSDKGSISSSENQENEAKSFVAPSPKENENPLDYAERIVEAKRLHDEINDKGKAKLSDRTVIPSGNRLVTDERYAELRERMRKKLGGQMNIGVDPEILAIGTEMAVYHIEKGLRKFSDYSKAMIDDLGDAIRPYLKSFYNGARDLPEVGENGWDKDMTPYEDVRSFDVANFDKPVPDIMDTAETVVKETEIAGQASVADKNIKNSRKKLTDKKDKSLPLSGNDLFTPNNIKDNEQGNSRTDQGVGRKAREEDRGSKRGGNRGGVHGSDVLDTEGGRGISVSDSDKRTVVRNQNNFSFPDKGINISGDISKLKANIEAIETLKDVEDGQGRSTPEQQAKMSRYVGWGGLAEALNERKYNARESIWSKDRNWNDKYLRYYEKLKSLLSKEEFDSAVRSTTTAHYTPSEVVKGLWDITERLGFKGGNISEPAMGIGNIIGMMPMSISENSSISGFEIDSLSGRMAKALYPDANIKVQGYEKAFSPNSKDLVITNVPFGKNAPYDKVLDKQFKKKLGSSYNLHNYFILKGLLELKEGGLGVFVTSSATMDGADSKFREYVSGNGYDLVGAIRLPNDAFQKGAGTSVTADIVIFRKRKPAEPSNGIGFTTITQIGEGSYMEDGDKRIKPILVNEYFANHPDMMLGDMSTAYDAGSGGLYSGASQTLKAKPGVDLSKELSNALNNLPKDILSDIAETKEPQIVRDSTLKDGVITVQDGKVFVVDAGSLKPVKANTTFVHNGQTRKIADAVNDYNDIKKNLYDLIHDEQTKGVDPEPARKRLNKVYDAFVSKYGTLNRNKALDDIFAEDVEHGLPFSLEVVRRVPSTTGKSMVWEVSKADGILNKRVSYPFEIPTKADNVLDAVNISKSYKGNIDIPYISGITGIGEPEVTNEILDKGIAYRDPVTGNIIDKSEYLSGNVKDKLVEARAALEDHPEFQKNVDDLEAVQPERVPYGEISYRLGTTWIPSEFVDNFAEKVLGISDANANFIPEIGEYILDKRAFIADYAKAGQFKTERMDAIDVFKAALNQRKPKVYDEIKYYEDGRQKTRRVVNEQETQAVAEKISDMSDKFVEYIDSKTMFHDRIEDVYNDKYNNYVLKKYDKPVFEHYPNADKNITLRDHQSKAVQRCLSESTLLAHQVGTGKTFTMITSAMEMRRLGIARKPMIVVQNATLEDFVRDFYKLYPSAKILSPTKEERNADNRTRLFNLIATGDFDAIVVPQSFMAFIPDSEERKKAYIQKRIDDFEEAIDRVEDKALQDRLKREAKSMRDSLEGIKKGKNVKGKAKTAETITAKTERILDRRTDNVMTFEQMGVDALFIDEAHNYKKIGFPSKMSNVKGIDTGASQRANSMLLKAQWISENNGGRNVVLATGTPITNTMAEVWTMMNFVAPDILEAYNINSFDEFATTFGAVEPSLEFTATGNFKIAERFKSYINVPELVKAFRSHTDVVLTEDVKEFKEDKNIPKLKDDKMANVIVDKNEDLEDVMQTLINELEAFSKLTGKEKKDKSALPLVVFSKAKQAAIDLRLLNPTFPDNPDSKTNKVVDNVLRLYKESDTDKGTQLIFCDSYQSPSETPKMDLFDVDLSVPQFNLYNDIKEKLIKGGIPSNQIAIVGNYDGERRNALFDKVRNGDVRVLIGSTEKMGVGVNVQDRLFALHHIDAPIRPMDFEQRNGRILRQGNLYATWNKPVNIVTYGVKGTLDATAYDRLRIKQNFINQMMKGDVSSRVMEEQDDSDPSGMTFSEMAATLSGDKTAQLLFVAQNKLKKLQNSKRSDLNSKSSMRDSISKSRLRIQEYNSRKEIMERNANIIKDNLPEGIESVTVKGNTFSDGISNELTSIIDDYYDRYTLDRNTPPLKISLNGGKGEAIVHFNEGMMVYSLYSGKEKLVDNRDFNGGRGLMASIDRQLGIPAKSVSDIAAKIKAEENKIAGLEEAVKKPWGKEDELNAAQAEVNDLQGQLVEKAKAENIHIGSNLDVDGTLVKEEGETRFRFMGMDTTSDKDNVSSIESSINDWSAKLNTPVRVIHDVDEITDTDERMLVRKRGSKGWYDPSTGEIVIVSPNSTSVGDAQRTFLHEVVGHHGLRELFGDDFDTFLDNVYRNANEDIRKSIIDRTKGNPLNLREATEEYLAELAEHGFDNKADRSLWKKIKDAFLDMLRKAGISLDFKLSDNDLRYILWRSYKNLEQGNLMDVAEDTVMRNDLGIGDFSVRFREAKTEVENEEPLNKEMVDAWDKVASSDSFKFKEAMVDSLTAIDEFLKFLAKKTKSKILDYENPYYALIALSSKNKADMDSFDSKFLNPLNEAIRALIGDVSEVSKKGLRRTWDWSKGPLRDLVKYVQAKHGIERNRDMSVRDGIEALKAFDVDALYKMGVISEPDLKNAKKTAENVAEEKGNEAYKKTYDKVLGKELKKGVDKGKAERSAEIAADYRKSFVKSEIYNKEMDKYKENVTGSLIDRWEDSKKDVFNKDLSWEEEQNELDREALSFQWKLGDNSYGVILGKDYSGLSSVFKPSEDGANKDKWLSDAYDFVIEYESTHDKVLVDNLWDKVHNVSEYTLRKQYDSGLISKSYMDKNLSRFKYFIPLRGFADNIASDVYDYIDATEIKMGNPVKTAKGRTSEADNPFAGLIHVGYGSITAGNRNLAKQRFLNLASNHDTGGLITIDNIWVRNIGTEENPEWVESIPQIPDNASGEEVAKALKDHEEMMRELREEGKAELIKGGRSDIPYKTLYDQRSQHQVQVLVGGNRYVMTVNGNPRLAQAVNGLTNPDVKDDLAYVVARNLKTFMAGAFTSKNVAFSSVNLIRDAPYANNSVFVTENFRYFKDFSGNQRRSLSGLRILGRNLYKYKSGEIDISDKEQAIFKEFMDNGGATGYTFVDTQKEYAKDLADKLEKLSDGNIGKLSPKELVSTVFECFEFMGNVAELVNRYAAYKTSREHGRSIDRSINDAKEVSVNFNKKGAGKKTKSDKWYINTAAWISEYGRDWVLFFNAAVQSMYKEYSMLRNHPIKGIGSRIAPLIFMGSSVSLLNNLFMPMLFAYSGWDSDDDDDRDYFDSLSDHERQNNICIRLPHGRWLKIPLALDLANYFKIGDIIAGHLSGKREVEAMDVVKTGIDMVSPLNINWEYDSWKFALNLLPTVVQPIAQNASNVNFMGNPIYKTSMNKANDYDPEYTKVYRSTSTTMVELSRALNSLTGGDDVKRGLSFNPATWQNIFSGYTGGFGTVALGVSDLVLDMLSGEDGDMPVSRYPLLSRFLTGGDKDLKLSRMNSIYIKKVVDFVTEMDHDYKGYLEKSMDPSINILDRAEYIVKLETFMKSDDFKKSQELSQYVKAISDMERFLREVGSDNDSLENQVYELKLRALEIFEVEDE